MIRVSLYELSSIVNAIASLIGAIGSVWAVIATRQNRASIDRVHTSTNSMKDELVRAVGDRRYAEGKAEGNKNDNCKG